MRTTGLPSLMSWASIMATLWSMVVEWSVLSAEFPTNVPRAKTAAHLTCVHARAHRHTHTHTHTHFINIKSKSILLQDFDDSEKVWKNPKKEERRAEISHVLS